MPHRRSGHKERHKENNSLDPRQQIEALVLENAGVRTAPMGSIGDGVPLRKYHTGRHQSPVPKTPKTTNSDDTNPSPSPGVIKRKSSTASDGTDKNQDTKKSPISPSPVTPTKQPDRGGTIPFSMTQSTGTTGTGAQTTQGETISNIQIKGAKRDREMRTATTQGGSREHGFSLVRGPSLPKDQGEEICYPTKEANEGNEGNIPRERGEIEENTSFSMTNSLRSNAAPKSICNPFGGDGLTMTQTVRHEIPAPLSNCVEVEVDRRVIFKTRFIKQTVLKLNAEGKGRLRLVATQTMDTLGDDTEKHFDNLNADDDPISPPEETPPLPSLKIYNRAHRHSLKEEEAYKGMNHVMHILASALAFERYLELPFAASNNGGYYYLIPVFLCQILVVWPSFLLELSLGQFTGDGPTELFRNMAPILRGFSILFIINRLVRALMTHSLPLEVMVLVDRVFLFVLGKTQRSCNPVGKYCHDYSACPHELVDGNCYEAWDGSPKQNYYVIVARSVAVMNNTSTAENTAPENEAILFASLLFCTAIYLFGEMATHRRGKHAFVYLVVSILSVFSILMLMVYEGIPIQFHLPNEAGKLLEPWVWVSAFRSACELMSLGDGTIHTLGTMMTFHSDAFFVTKIAATTNVILICLSFVVVVPYLNSGRYNFHSDSELMSSHRFLQSLRRSDSNWPNAFVFVMIIHLAIVLSQLSYMAIALDSLTRFLETRLSRMTHAFYEMVPPIRNHAVKLSCMMLYVILNMQAVTHDNEIISASFYRLVSTIAVPSVIFFEFLIVGYQYGIQRYIVNMQTMYGGMEMYWLNYGLFKVIVVVIAPIFCLSFFFWHCALLSSVIDPFNLLYVISSSLLALLVMRLTTKYYLHGVSGVFLLLTESHWGPKNKRMRAKVVYDERAARLFH